MIATGSLGIGGVTDPSASHNSADDLVIGGSGPDRGMTILTDNDQSGGIYFADATDDTSKEYDGSKDN